MTPYNAVGGPAQHLNEGVLVASLRITDIIALVFLPVSEKCRAAVEEVTSRHCVPLSS